jgi:putative transcriptional regulator
LHQFIFRFRSDKLFEALLNSILTEKEAKNMGVSYKKLWKLLIDKDIKKTQMREKVGISTSTLSKLTREEYVSLDVLVRICSYLKCQISDICEVIYEEKCEG